MLRFLENLNLRVVRAHMALAARPRVARQFDRRRMTGVAHRAGADGPVRIGLTDIMALVAAAIDRLRAFESDQGVGGSVHGAFVIFLRELDLLRRKIPGSRDGSPCRRRM